MKPESAEYTHHDAIAREWKIIDGNFIYALASENRGNLFEIKISSVNRFMSPSAIANLTDYIAEAVKSYDTLRAQNAKLRAALHGYVMAMGSGNPDLLEHADKMARAALKESEPQS